MLLMDDLMREKLARVKKLKGLISPKEPEIDQSLAEHIAELDDDMFGDSEASNLAHLAGKMGKDFGPWIKEYKSLKGERSERSQGKYQPPNENQVDGEVHNEWREYETR
jgi:hypothetical protein